MDGLGIFLPPHGLGSAELRCGQTLVEQFPYEHVFVKEQITGLSIFLNG